MIFVSSSCIKSDKIGESVRILANYGYKCIELSGGTAYYPDFEDDLLEQQKEFGLSYLLHNYFPPPIEHFVLNLASLDDDVYNKSIKHFKRALDLSQKLGATKYGIHAGFLIDPKVNELGQKIGHQKRYDSSLALEQFANAYYELCSYAPDVDLHIENNVYSLPNKDRFGFNPFLFTDYQSYLELKQLIDFNVLLDWAHLKVSCNTLGLNLINELKTLAPIANYYHISDNNGVIDSNKTVEKNSFIFRQLKKYLTPEKDITIEVYDGLTTVEKSYQLLHSVYT